MDDPASVAEATQVSFLWGGIKEELEREINAEIKRLLEEKHLYQSFKIDADTGTRIPTGVSTANVLKLKGHIDKFVESSWVIQPAQLPGGPPLRRIIDKPDAPHLAVDTVKLSCRACERLEPYNLVSTAEIYAPMEKLGIRISRGRAQQMILLSYQCQACKGVPEVFLISRYGKKATLVGRAPMEEVQVPDVIPKSHRKYFSDAIIAFQSGQVLPALFMLRTFIEQFAASIGNVAPADRADEILDRYMASLHDAVRAHFPSLRDVYGRLSAALHAARPDADLFQQSSSEVVRHFEARRLYGAA